MTTSRKPAGPRGHNRITPLARLQPRVGDRRPDQQLDRLRCDSGGSQLHWAGGDDSWCTVIDDGSGMTEERLRAAMRLCSADPLADRGLGELGRFGFGLKTAAFS